MRLFYSQHLLAAYYYYLLLVSYARNVRLSLLAGQAKGSNVVVCSSDTQPLIFMCECTGAICKWFLDPVVSSSNAIEFIFDDEPGDIIPRDSLTAYLIKKTTHSSGFVYESQLFVPINAIRDVESLPAKVVCENDRGNRDTMSITTPGT